MYISPDPPPEILMELYQHKNHPQRLWWGWSELNSSSSSLFCLPRRIVPHQELPDHSHAECREKGASSLGPARDVVSHEASLWIWDHSSNGSKSVRTLCLVTKNYTDHQHSYKPAGWFRSTKENRDPPVLPVAVSFQWFRLFEKTSGKTLFSLWKSTSLERNPPFWCNPKLPQAHPDTLDPHVAETLGFPRRTQHPLPPPR